MTEYSLITEKTTTATQSFGFCGIELPSATKIDKIEITYISSDGNPVQSQLYYSPDNLTAIQLEAIHTVIGNTETLYYESRNIIAQTVTVVMTTNANDTKTITMKLYKISTPCNSISCSFTIL